MEPSRDIRAEFDRLIEQMEWGEVLATLQDVIDEALGATPEPVAALAPELDSDIQSEPVGDEHEAQGHQGVAPHTPEHMQTGLPPSCQEDVHSLGQHNLYQSVYEQPGPSTAACCPAAPPHTCNNTVVITVIENKAQKLVPIRLANGEVVYAYTLHPISAAPPPPASMSAKRKRKLNKPHEKDKPYTKRPLSAFMLFLKEQRQNVVAEIKIRDNATVNCVVGHRWALLSQQEKAKYYEQAEKEKLLYAMQNPGWTSSGKKKTREGVKTPTEAESSGSKPERQQQMEQTPSALKEPLTPNTTMELHHSLDTET